MAGEGQRFPSGGSAGHHDVDALALFDAGALDPLVAAEVGAHLARCARCSAVLARLRWIRAELAALPPPRLPDGVAGRLDAALRAARQARAGGPHRSGPAVRPAGHAGVTDFDHVGPAPPGSRGPRPEGPASDLGTARRRRRVARVTVWAAAAAVLLGGTGVGAAVLHGSGSTSENLAGAAPASSPTPTSSNPPRRAGRSSALSPQVLSSGTVPSYTRDDIGARLGQILIQAGCQSGGCDSVSAGAMADPGRRARCLAALGDVAGVTGEPTAVQFALFEGRPAFVLVFGTDQIVVVDRACGTSGPATVLFRQP